VVNSTILHLARRQFGVVARHQIIADSSASAISRLTSDGRLVTVLPGVYRLASAPDTFLARCFATQLWAGEVGFVSSWSAARLRGLRKMPTERIHFTVPWKHARRSPSWIHLDRSKWYREADRETLRSGLVVATPLRMLFGLAADFNQHRFNRAAEDAWHLGLTNPDEMSRYLQQHRCRGKDGVTTMEAFVDLAASRARPAQSGLEQEFIEAFAAVLPPIVRQYRLTLLTGEVVKLDIAWPDIRLAVEPGSSWFHGGDAGQARDHDRDLACNEVGWMIIRLDESFRLDPAGAASRVRRAYYARRGEISTPAPTRTAPPPPSSPNFV
jgi:hypothetical protein